MRTTAEILRALSARRENQRQGRRARYATRKARGLCPFCPAPLPAKFSACFSCRRHRAAKAAAYRAGKGNAS